MRAVVLVGGFGTRLRPLTYTTPKPLLPVGHRPILELVLANLTRAGIDAAVLSLGFQPDAFTDRYPDRRCAGVALEYAVEPEPLDTAGAIAFAARHAGIDETFVVVNGDVLTDLDVGRLLEAHRRTGAEATIHLTPVDDPSAFGVVPTDADGRVIAFIEKPAPGEAPTNRVNGGTYVLEPSVLDRIPGGRRVSIERETFPAVVADGSLYAVGTDDYWTDTGRPDLYLAANLDALAGRRRDGRVDPLGPGCDVAGEVVDSVVGAGSRIAARASVTGSVLLPGAVVDERAQVKGSCLGAGVRVGPGATVVDCVLGDGESVPAGAELVSERRPPA
jgi:mannose-1-phosphate guanylyltransferase